MLCMHSAILFYQFRPSVHLSQSWSWVTFSKPNPTQNFWNRPNPQKSSPDPTQPIIDTWYGILVIPKTLYNNCYMSQTSSQIKISKQSRTYPIFSLLTLHSSLHPTQPNPPKIKKTLTQPNPIHGWTQPMTNSDLSYRLFQGLSVGSDVCLTMMSMLSERLLVLSLYASVPKIFWTCRPYRLT